MAIQIIAWPPVGLKSVPVWHRTDPVQTSRSLLTGKRYVSAHGRSRIVAELSVSARKRGTGAGYMESLRRLLAGGVNLVRLGYRPRSRITGRPVIVTWAGDGSSVRWYELSEDVTWYTSMPGIGTPTMVGPFPAVIVTGLPASQTVALPGEFIRIEGEVRMIVAEAVSDADGEAVIRIDAAFPNAGVCTVGEPETGIFEVTSWPSGGGPLDADYTYDWRFRQVFADEIGETVDVNPWE